MKATVRGLLASLAIGAGVGMACSEDDPGCSECDPATQYCVEYGTDVSGESSAFSCVALPTACETDASCTCMQTVDDDESNIDSSLQFCLVDGGCRLTDGVVHVTCPGG